MAPEKMSFFVPGALIISLAFTAACVPAAAQAADPTASQRPGREVSLPPSQVRDTFFAYVLGIISAGIEVDVGGEEMRAILTEFTSSLSLPFDLIKRVTQHTDEETGVRTIGLDFQGDVSIPIPFSILFYHPGSIMADRSLLFRVDRSVLTDPAGKEAPGPAFDLVITGGGVLVDIDDWLEVLFSASLEDTWIRHIVFFTWQGEWIGLLQGTGSSTGRVLRAYFNFTRNRIVFPVPSALDRQGKVLVP
jgi:hypothetical protein